MGLKRICPQCNTRYYDMKKRPPVCLSCGVVFDPETLMKSRRDAPLSKRKTERLRSVPEVIEEFSCGGR